MGSIEDLDSYYERLGNFTGLYARHIFNRMAKTVPKAIVLCQVRGRGSSMARQATLQPCLAVSSCLPRRSPSHSPTCAQLLLRAHAPVGPRVAQIIRSRDRLLDQLYNFLMSLKPFEVDALLAEDPTLVKR